MSHEKVEKIESDDSDEPTLETLLIKKGPNGYTIEKRRKKEPSHLNKKPEPTNQTMFYMVPVSKSPSLTSEELSQIYAKYVEQNPFLSNFFASDLYPQQANIPNSMINCKDTYQDPFVDSTKRNEDLYDQNKTIFIEDESEFKLSEEDYFLSTRSLPSSSGGHKQLFEYDDDNSSQIGFEFVKHESFGEGQDSQLLDPIILARSLGGGYYVKKDCLIGGKSRNISGLEGLQVENSNFQVKLNYSDVHFGEPLLEKLFSNVSDISQATTRSITSCDQMEYSTEVETDEDDVDADKSLQNTTVLEDGSLPVINRNNSDVVFIRND